MLTLPLLGELNLEKNKASGGDGIPVTILKDDAVKVLHSICQQIWTTQQWPQDWKMSVFIPILKKGNAKECSDYHIIALILHASKVMLKILQAKLQQYVNWEFPDVQAGFRKGRGTRGQIANIWWITEKARGFQKNICFSDYVKAFECVDHKKLWKILQEMGKPDCLNCLLGNQFAGQEATDSRLPATLLLASSNWESASRLSSHQAQEAEKETCLHRVCRPLFGKRNQNELLDVLKKYQGWVWNFRTIFLAPVCGGFRRDQALSLWSGNTDSKNQNYQRTDPREYQIVRTHTKETTWI